MASICLSIVGHGHSTQAISKAATYIVARAQEASARQLKLRAHLADLRVRVAEIISQANGIVRLIGLKFWPIEASYRLSMRELRAQLEVEQYDLMLEHRREFYHGYSVRELTFTLRQDFPQQRRLAEARRLFDESGVNPVIDEAAQLALIDRSIRIDKVVQKLLVSQNHDEGCATA